MGQSVTTETILNSKLKQLYDLFRIYGPDKMKRDIYEHILQNVEQGIDEKFHIIYCITEQAHFHKSSPEPIMRIAGKDIPLSNYFKEMDARELLLKKWLLLITTPEPLGIVGK